MILEEETFRKFGYNSSDCLSGSHKKIVVACDDCGKVRTIEKRQYRSICFPCAMQKRRGKNNHRWKPKVECICEICGGKFKVNPSVVLKGHGRFCSWKCQNAWKSENTKGKNSVHWKGGKLERICKYCGKTIKIHPSQIKYGKGRYCSHSCTRKGRKGFPKHHTKPERIFEQICKTNDLPYKYTGDGAFWIGKKPSVNPDFVECNGKKIAIEIFSYWHDPLRRHCKIPHSQTYEGRKEILKKYGWKLVVFWQEDLEREDAEAFVLNELQKGGIIK